jgi:hypothetical protein
MCVINGRGFMRMKRHTVMLINIGEEVEGEYKIGIALSTEDYKI